MNNNPDRNSSSAAIHQCYSCGGRLELREDNIYHCTYCTNTYDYQGEVKLSTEDIDNLNNARAFLEACDFDRAYDLYMKSKDVPGAYFGALLAEYCVQYVLDAEAKSASGLKTYKPTLRSLKSKPIKDWFYYGKLTAAERARAKEIESIRRNAWEMSKKVGEYDIFICLKRELPDGKNGELTPEYEWAKQIYTHYMGDKDNDKPPFYSLKYKRNIKVFFCDESLSKSNVDWEPHIYSALRSSKIMLVLTTSRAHVDAQWVKNEWGRFYDFSKELVEKGQPAKPIRTIYEGIDIDDLPARLTETQAINHADKYWLDELDASLNELFGMSTVLTSGRPTALIAAPSYKNTLSSDKTSPKTPITQSEESDLAAAEQLLAEGNFMPARKAYLNLIIKNSACYKAHLGLALCQIEAHSFDEAVKLLSEGRIKRSRDEDEVLCFIECAFNSSADDSFTQRILEGCFKIISGSPTVRFRTELVKRLLALPELVDYRARMISVVSSIAIDSIRNGGSIMSELMAMCYGIIETVPKEDWLAPVGEYADALLGCSKYSIAKTYLELLATYEPHAQRYFKVLLSRLGTADFPYCDKKLKLKKTERTDTPKTVSELGLDELVEHIILCDYIAQDSTHEYANKIYDFILYQIKQRHDARLLIDTGLGILSYLVDVTNLQNNPRIEANMYNKIADDATRDLQTFLDNIGASYRMIEQFKNAEHYYNLLLSVNRSSALAYWGLLHCHFKTHSELELSAKPRKKLVNNVLCENALRLATEEERQFFNKTMVGKVDPNVYDKHKEAIRFLRGKLKHARRDLREVKGEERRVIRDKTNKYFTTSSNGYRYRGSGMLAYLNYFRAFWASALIFTLTLVLRSRGVISFESIGTPMGLAFLIPLIVSSLGMLFFTIMLLWKGLECCWNIDYINSVDTPMLLRIIFPVGLLVALFNGFRVAAKRHRSRRLAKKVRAYGSSAIKKAISSIKRQIVYFTRNGAYFDTLYSRHGSKTVASTASANAASAAGFYIKGGVLLEYRGAEKQVKIPDGVNHVGSYSFVGKNEVESIALPISVSTVMSRAFVGCPGLKTVKLPTKIVTEKSLARFAHRTGIDTRKTKIELY